MLAAKEIMPFCKAVKNKSICGDQPISRFSMTTNATLLDEEIVKHIADIGIQLCVSVDGPQIIHDTNRVYTNGRGSFQNVMRGMRYLQNHHVDYAVEATITIDQIRDLLLDEQLDAYFDFFKNSGAVLATVQLDGLANKLDSEQKRYLAHFYTVMVDCFFRQMCSDNVQGTILLNVLDICRRVMCGHLLSAKQECAAGLSQVFISATGDVYPCHVYYADKYERLGDIWHVEDLQNVRRQVMSRYHDRTPNECCSCSYSKMCHEKCPGMRLLSCGSENALNETACFANRELINRVLYRLSHFENERDRVCFERNIQNAAKSVDYMRVGL